MINNCYTFKELKEKFGWTTTEGSIKDQIRYARKRNVNIEVAFKEGPTYFKILNLDEANLQNNELWVTYPKDPKFEVTKSGKVRNAITLALVGHKTENGYLVVTNSENKDYRIHRMVMETFYPRPDSDNLIVDHINGDKTNNSIENLRWATYSEQNSRFNTIGIRSEKVIVTHENGTTMEFERITDVAEHFNCNISNISQMLKKGTFGKRGKTRHYKFEYNSKW